MVTSRWLFLAAAICAAGCGGGVAQGKDSAGDSSADVAPASDAATGDAAPTDDLQGLDVIPSGDAAPGDAAPETAAGPDDGAPAVCEGCATGSVHGTTCARDSKIAIPDVGVWVDAIDCTGAKVLIQTKSDAKGNFVLDGVPCGPQTVHLKKGSFTWTFQRDVPAGGVVTGGGADQCFGATASKLAVVGALWDHIQNVLKVLGLGYDLFDLQDTTSSDDTAWEDSDAVHLLLDPTKLAGYDVLFINCGNVHTDVLSYYPAVIQNLQDFVKNGGSVYVSDWAFVYVDQAWPGAIQFPSGGFTHPYDITVNETVTADVLDAALAAYLAKTQVSIGFLDTPQVVANASGSSTQMLMQADFQKQTAFKGVRPIMFSFQPYPAGGTVVFIDFHTQDQAGTGYADMTSILYYTVFML